MAAAAPSQIADWRAHARLSEDLLTLDGRELAALGLTRAGVARIAALGPARVAHMREMARAQGVDPDRLAALPLFNIAALRTCASCCHAARCATVLRSGGDEVAFCPNSPLFGRVRGHHRPDAASALSRCAAV